MILLYCEKCDRRYTSDNGQCPWCALEDQHIKGVFWTLSALVATIIGVVIFFRYYA